NTGVANTAVANAYAVCWVEDCTLGYAHYHDDLYCLPHNALDGHGYHEACDVAGCSRIGVHTHYAGACHR
ncbi:MAG: hypothetical protein LBC41_15135, partial [Clostridiales bacterium]|nr:hypothetical protein [Clostridiales bacterium]